VVVVVLAVVPVPVLPPVEVPKLDDVPEPDVPPSTPPRPSDCVLFTVLSTTGDAVERAAETVHYSGDGITKTAAGAPNCVVQPTGGLAQPAGDPAST
jgi:hypothetical protein